MHTHSHTHISFEKLSSSSSEQILVIVRLGAVASGKALRYVLEPTRTGFASVVASYGDGPLPNNSDPYAITSNGLKFVVHSRRQYMTYRNFINALKGLLSVLLDEAHDNEMGFDIIEYGRGRIGGGTLRKEKYHYSGCRNGHHGEVRSRKER